MGNENSIQYQMHKRRELMADNRRYIIYYTFGENVGAMRTEMKSEQNAPVTETINSDSEIEDKGSMQPK